MRQRTLWGADVFTSQVRYLAAVTACAVSAACVASADLREVVPRLESKDAKVRLKAAEELGDAGKDAAPFLRQLTDATADANPQVAKAALVSISKVDAEYHRSLSRFLYAQPAEKAEAVRTLAALKERAAPAAGVIEVTLRNELGKQPTTAPSSPTKTKTPAPRINAGLAAVSLDALSSLKAHSPETLKMVKAVAGPDNPHPQLKEGAVNYLVAWAGKDEAKRREVPPSLKAGIEAKSPSPQCIRVAGEYGPLAAELLPLIDPLAASRSTAVRDAAVAAAASIRRKND